MIIETRGTEYYVISAQSEKPEIFICREKESQSTMKYTILRLPIAQITAEMIGYLMSQVKNESFVEFVDYTTDDAYLYVVMSNPDGRTFQEPVDNGELSLTERLVLGKKCLEHLFLSDFPDYFTYSALRGGQFKITDALDVNFEFDLSDFTGFQKIGLNEATAALGKTFTNIFHPELDRVAFDPMKEFIDKLNSGAYASLMDAYRDYEEIYKEWKGKESYELPSHTKWEKFKEWLKKVADFAKSALIYVILIAAFLYLVDSIYQLTRPYEEKNVYDKIGDIFIINEEEQIDGE